DAPPGRRAVRRGHDAPDARQARADVRGGGGPTLYRLARGPSGARDVDGRPRGVPPERGPGSRTEPGDVSRGALPESRREAHPAVSSFAFSPVTAGDGCASASV